MSFVSLVSGPSELKLIILSINSLIISPVTVGLFIILPVHLSVFLILHLIVYVRMFLVQFHFGGRFQN